MNFVYILIYLVLITHTFRISIVGFLIDFFYDFHVSCLKLAPDHVRSVESLHALVCGKNYTDVNQAQLLIAAGLIHIFVVSGSHLRVLQKILQLATQKLCNKEFFAPIYVQLATLLALFIYCAVCKFNPPIFRSFIAITLVFCNEQLGLKWKTQTMVLAAGLLSLVMAPDWVNSLSLQMSWIAALTLVVISHFFSQSNLLFKNFLFYLQYLCTFSFIGLPSIMSVVIATIFTPFLEFVLFPLALSVYLLPSLSPVFDLIIQSLNYFLSQLHLSVLFRIYESEKVIFLNWLFICSMHAFLQKQSESDAQ